jgi:hypothetical protein
MKINIELTSEQILTLITPEQAKQIITEMLQAKQLTVNVPVSNEEVKPVFNETPLVTETSTPEIKPLFNNAPLVTERRPTRSKSVCDKQTFEEIKAQYAKGKSISDLEQKYSISYKTLWRKLNDAGALKKKSRQ